MKAYESGSAAYFATPPVNLIYAFHASLSAITKSSPSLADRFKLPVLSFADTSGAYPGVSAEERGQAEAIARNPVLTDFAERAAEGRRRWRDWEGAWYYAGLAAGGLEVDWRSWYRGRIAVWTNGLSSLEGPSAIEELTSLEHGDKDHMQSLPAYWT